MKEQHDLNKDEKTFLLKMIMIADLSTAAYKFLAKNQSILSQVENRQIEDFPEDYVKNSVLTQKERDNLNKILQIIRTPPLSKELTVDISTSFQLVGSFEEQIPETTKFNEHAGKNPAEAINFLQSIEWDFEPRLSSLAAEISQEIGKIDFDPNGSLDENQELLLSELRHRTRTVLLVIENYLEKERLEKIVKKVFSPLFENYISLGQHFSSTLSDLEQDFIDKALNLDSKNFFEKFFALDKFNSDFDELKNTINYLGSEKLAKSPVVITLVSNKVLSFIAENTAEAVKIIEDKKLLEIEEVQLRLVDYFLSENDPGKRDLVFSKINFDSMLNDKKDETLENLFSNEEFLKIQELIKNEHLNPDKFRDLVSKHELSESSITFFESIWKEPFIDTFNFLEESFFNSLGKKIYSIPEDPVKEKYIEILTSNHLVDFFRKEPKEKKKYIKLLTDFKSHLIRGQKAKVTRFVNRKLK